MGPLVILLFCYFTLVKTVTKLSMISEHGRIYKSILVKRVCWLLSVFIISWSPFYILKLIISMDGCIMFENTVVYDLNKLFSTLGYVGSCINPFLYAMLTDDFRNDVVKFIGATEKYDLKSHLD